MAGIKLKSFFLGVRVCFFCVSVVIQTKRGGDGDFAL